MKYQFKLNIRVLLWSCFFVGFTSLAMTTAGRTELAFVGALAGLLIAAAWVRFVLLPADVSDQIGRERLQLNLTTQGLQASTLRHRRLIFAGGFLAVWLAGVIPPVTPHARQAYGWLERNLRSEQVFLRIEYPSYVDTPAQEIRLKGDADVMPEVDTDAYFSVSFRYRKAETKWSVGLTAVGSSAAPELHAVPPTANFGNSARSVLTQLALDPQSEHTVELNILKNASVFAKQKLKITPRPRPQVELSKSAGGPEREGSVALDVLARSKIPLASVEFHVRTESGYRMVKPVAEFANANEQSFDGKRIPFNTVGIPFTAKDTLYIKAVAKTVAENLFGESEELKFEIVTRESLRQDLIQSLEKSLQALQNKSISADALKETLRNELAKAREAAGQMGSQSVAAKQTEQISQSAENINSPRDKAAQQTEKKIKNLLERLKREQTSNQVQNLLARLQNLKQSIQRSNPEQLSQLNKDADELRGAANSLKKQLSSMIEKPNSGLSLQERQTALDALKLDNTPENLKDLGKTLSEKNQTEAINKSQSTLEHAQKHLGGVLSMLQQARQRAMREARERLTRADSELQNAKRDQKSAKDSLGKSQQDLDSLPDISNEFQEAAQDAQKGNQKARQGAQSGQQQQMESGIDDTQEAIVRALAALQDEEEAERQSQQEQDGQNFRSTQEAIAAQGQLDMGWRRQILDEIARLRAAGEPSDSPAIQYLESRLR
ncbi:MAG: hypothetical protein RLZZ488_658 [Pseudomonadota bacterium]|jgi:hypothetical protein